MKKIIFVFLVCILCINNVSAYETTATIQVDNCANFSTWSASATYVAGDNVKYNNVHYRAKWWTRNNIPENNIGDGLPWERIGPCTDTGGGNVSPTVSITSPTNGISFNEGTAIAIAANAADSDGTVTRVEFFNGSTKLGEDTSSPYNYTISNAAVGSYTLTAKATDNEGAMTTSSSVAVTVVGDNPGGGCDGIVQYVAGTSYAQNQEVQNDNQKFKCNIPGWCSSSAAWAYAPGTGAHWQSAWTKTGDCNGDIGTPPSVSITSPANGSTYTPGGGITINATASDDGAVTKVEFFDGTTKLGEDTSNPYSFTITNARSGKYILTAIATDDQGNSTTSSAVVITDGVVTPISGKILVGYWHNFDNGSTTPKLRDVSRDWDVICIAFAEPRAGSGSDMLFSPYGIYGGNTQEFIDDVAVLQSRGQKVLISIGGANARVELTNTTERDEFITSMTDIINTYGFDGLDIDLEGSSVSLSSGDNDFRNPTTPKIINLINATKTIRNNIGPNRFTLSMAPETAFVQGGYSNYTGIFGAYLPVIHNLRNEMDYIHVQHYNTGSMFGRDGVVYQPATADFHVAMAEMLITGFKVAQTGLNFPGLRADQVAIGLPAEQRAAGSGYTSEAVVQQALDYLIKGISYPGRSYTTDATYPNFRGLMTWSINWDLANNSQFSSSHRAYLDGIASKSVSAKTIGDFSISPNPAQETIRVHLNSSKPNLSYRMEIYNMSGMRVLDFKDNTIRQGNNSKDFTLTNLRTGIYFYKVSIPNEGITAKGKLVIE
ncbi:Ig-like domain-containing protein [Aquimarina sp. 2201CG1-2-11]|uniref:Ig-like domain-containing protein n=1 Tax=Aquimarina discodermiae TaxID=3231043 RepID=UPI0034629498